MIVTELRSDRIPTILPLVLAMCKEVKETVDLVYFTNTWRGILDNGSGSIFTFNRTNGVIGCLTTHHPLNGSLVAYLMFEYMKPEYRGKYGIRMFQQFESWAKDRGSVSSCAGHNHNEPTDEHSAMLLRHGYTSRETIWVKEL